MWLFPPDLDWCYLKVQGCHLCIFFSWFKRLSECEIWGQDRHWPVKQSKLTPTHGEIKLLRQHTASTGFENANSSSALNFVPFKALHMVFIYPLGMHEFLQTYLLPLKTFQRRTGLVNQSTLIASILKPGNQAKAVIKREHSGEETHRKAGRACNYCNIN